MIITYRDTDCDIKKAGGKAYNLWRLSREGFNVPKWIVLSADIFSDALGSYLVQYRMLLENYRNENREKITYIINNCSFTEKMKQDIIRSGRQPGECRNLKLRDSLKQRL